MDVAHSRDHKTCKGQQPKLKLLIFHEDICLNLSMINKLIQLVINCWIKPVQHRHMCLYTCIIQSYLFRFKIIKDNNLKLIIIMSLG